MEGFLKKWTNYVTSWKKRYFELKNGVLQYSKTKQGKRKGALYMSTTEISRHKSKMPNRSELRCNHNPPQRLIRKRSNGVDLSLPDLKIRLP